MIFVSAQTPRQSWWSLKRELSSLLQGNSTSSWCRQCHRHQSSCHLYCGCSFCWHHLVIIVVIIVKVISKVTDKNSFIPPVRHHYHRYLRYDHYHLTSLSPLSSLSWLSQRSEVQRPTFHGPSPGNGYNAQRLPPLLHFIITTSSIDQLLSW